jgi:hypothetical protein
MDRVEVFKSKRRNCTLIFKSDIYSLALFLDWSLFVEIGDFVFYFLYGFSDISMFSEFGV